MVPKIFIVASYCPKFIQVSYLKISVYKHVHIFEKSVFISDILIVHFKKCIKLKSSFIYPI